MNFRSIVAALVLTGLVGSMTGCNTLKDARAAEGSGQSRTYAAQFDAVWEAMPQVVSAVGLDFVSASREDQCVLAQRGVSAFSYGENVAIFVRPRSESSTSVEVISKKSMETNLFATHWPGPIFQQLEKRFTRE